MRIALDIFCGSGSFGNVARTFGYEVISVDNRRRSGVCEPNLKLDLSKVPGTFFSSLNPSLAWFGLPCTIWSTASGGYHLDSEFNPKTELAKNHLFLLEKVLEIIENSPGLLWFIENPRGKLHKYPPLKKWIDLNGGYVYECTLSSYGFPTTKPTVIITNYPDLKLKPLDPFGRGAKNKSAQLFSNMTTVQRQQTPKKLIRSVLKQVL